MLKKIHLLMVLLIIAFMTSNSLCLRIPDDREAENEKLEKVEVDGLVMPLGIYLSLYEDIRRFEHQGLEDKIDERLMIESVLTTKKEVKEYRKVVEEKVKFYPKLLKKTKEVLHHIDKKYPEGVVIPVDHSHD